MKFNDTFSEFMDLYTEDAETDIGEDTISELSAIDYDLNNGATVEDILRDYGPKLLNMYLQSRALPSEDNELAKKVGKGALKVAGRAALGTTKLGLKAGAGVLDYITHGDFSKTVKTVKDAYSGPKEDAEDKTGEEIDEFHKALDELVHKYLGHSSDETNEDNEQPSDDFFAALDDVVMVTGTEDFHDVVAGMKVKLGKKEFTDLELEWMKEVIQDDELPEEDGEQIDKDRMK